MASQAPVEKQNFMQSPGVASQCGYKNWLVFTQQTKLDS